MANSNFKQLIQFFSGLLLVLLIVFICDRGIGLLMKKFYFSQKSGVYYQNTYSFDSTSADLLIFGSSRAAHHYIPEIFENRLQSSCCNTGLDGSSILYNSALFKAITERYTPKQIIIDIRPYELEYDPVDYEKLSVLLPYFQSHPEIGHIVDLRGPFEKIKRISSIYPYNSLIIQIGTGNLRHNNKANIDRKGYIPIYKTMGPGEIDTLEILTNNIDKNKEQALEDMILTCRKKDIELILVNSPIYYVIKDSSYNKALHELCSRNEIRFFDMSNPSDFINNPGYFADKSHLNDEGAKLFTNKLIDRILQNN